MTASIAALNADLTAAETELETARKAAQRVAELEANVLRLRAALKHLEAPQTPEGRKRIAEGQRRRKKSEPPRPRLTCAECLFELTAARPGRDCRDCDLILHNDCMTAHAANLHSGGKQDRT